MAEIIHEVRLPVTIERNALGGPGFLTVVVTLDSGHERRTIKWADFRGEWDIAYGLMDMEPVDLTTAVHELRDFFIARNGRAYGFRYKDFTDFELARQNIGTTDTATAAFQIFKRYSSGGVDHDHDLKKIAADTETVWVNGAIITKGAGTGQYALDDDTGIVTLGSALAEQTGTAVEVECEFDKPVRFDIDRLEINLRVVDAGNIPSIPIVELRL